MSVNIGYYLHFFTFYFCALASSVLMIPTQERCDMLVHKIEKILRVRTILQMQIFILGCAPVPRMGAGSTILVEVPYYAHVLLYWQVHHFTIVSGYNPWIKHFTGKVHPGTYQYCTCFLYVCGFTRTRQHLVLNRTYRVMYSTCHVQRRYDM